MNKTDKRIFDNLPIKLYKIILLAGKVANTLKYSAYIAGGFVRDLFLDVDNIDIDLVIEGDGIRFAKTLAGKINGSEIKTHERFLTAKIITKEGFKIDIASTRKEKYEQSASLPVVKEAGIQEDLFRRDFSINALAVKIDSKGFGEIIDYYEGRKDLKNKKIRILHNLSFYDDPTRIFRAIRFEQRYGFKLENHTKELIKEALKLRLLDRLTPVRIQNEIVLILKEKEPIKQIKRMSELGVLTALFPKMKINKDIERQFNEIGKHEKKDGEKWISYFLALIDNFSKAERESICKKLNFDGYVTKAVFQAEGKKRIFKLLKQNRLPLSGISKTLKEILPETLLFLYANSRDKLTRNRISDSLSGLSQKQSLIDGNDLKKLGLKQGPVFKKILGKIGDLVIDGKITTKKEALKYAKDCIKKSKYL